jgi:hypothetical protein
MKTKYFDVMSVFFIQSLLSFSSIAPGANPDGFDFEINLTLPFMPERASAICSRDNSTCMDNNLLVRHSHERGFQGGSLEGGMD